MKKDAKKQSSLENKDCLILAQANNFIGNGDSAHKTSNNTEAATVTLTMLQGRVEIILPNVWRLRNIKAIENNCGGKQPGCKKTGH